MKKTIITLSLCILSLSIMAFGFINWGKNGQIEKETACCVQMGSAHNMLYPMDKKPNPNFHYAVGSRFNATISKEKLYSAKTIMDLLPKEGTQDLSAYENVRVSVYSEAGEILAGEVFKKAINENLSDAQLELLKNCTYTSNFSVHADAKITDPYSREQKDYSLVYYVSVVPETQAKYIDGKESLIEYLKKNSINETADLKESEMKPGMLHFVIAADGSIGNIRILSSCGHVEVDQKMEKLILSSSEKWNAAKNSKSENIDQEMIFFYGIIGC